MRKTSETVLIKELAPDMEPFFLSVFSDSGILQGLASGGPVPASFRRWSRDKVLRYLLYTGDEPIGAVTFEGDPPRCFFSYAMVREFNCPRLARRCVESIERHAKDLGFRTATTIAASDNFPSRGILERAGFRRFRWMRKDEAR